MQERSRWWWRCSIYIDELLVVLCCLDLLNPPTVLMLRSSYPGPGMSSARPECRQSKPSDDAHDNQPSKMSHFKCKPTTNISNIELLHRSHSSAAAAADPASYPGRARFSLTKTFCISITPGMESAQQHQRGKEFCCIILSSHHVDDVVVDWPGIFADDVFHRYLFGRRLHLALSTLARCNKYLVVLRRCHHYNKETSNRFIGTLFYKDLHHPRPLVFAVAH